MRTIEDETGLDVKDMEVGLDISFLDRKTHCPPVPPAGIGQAEPATIFPELDKGVTTARIGAKIKPFKSGLSVGTGGRTRTDTPVGGNGF